MALLVLYGKLVRHGGGHFDACRLQKGDFSERILNTSCDLRN
jgi:hypothetical protein